MAVLYADNFKPFYCISSEFNNDWRPKNANKTLRILRDVFPESRPAAIDHLPGYSRIWLIATYMIQFSTLSSNMFLKIFYVKPFSRYDDSKFENAWFLWIFTMSHSDLLIIKSRALVLLRHSSFDSAENSLQNIVKKHAYRARLREKWG